MVRYKSPVEYGKIGVRRNHVDTICLEHGAIGRSYDSDLAIPGEQLGQGACIMRRQVLDHHKGRVDVGNVLRSSSMASSPPAEAPIPTTKRPWAF